MNVSFATTSRLGRVNTKLLRIDGATISHHRLEDLPDMIENSVIIVNDAATLPASFQGKMGSLPVELRLIRNKKPSKKDIREWDALAFYRGSWRQRTEDRLSPDFIEVGDIIEIGELLAEVQQIHHRSKRLIRIEFQGELQSLWTSIYRYGKPIQYSHLSEPLELWDIQSIFSSIPVAVEPASASFQFTWALLNKLEQNQNSIASLTHAIGISSTGISELDQDLPFDEYYWIPDKTANLINTAINEEQPIIALGTSVTRALEDNYFKFNRIKEGQFNATAKITQSFQREVVTGLITGMHLSTESHIELLHNFVKPKLLQQAYKEANHLGYLWHEYGDLSFIHSEKQY